MAALCLGTFALVMFGFGDGQLGDGTCNERLDEICREAFRARCATFVCMTWFSLFLAWQSKYKRMFRVIVLLIVRFSDLHTPVILPYAPQVQDPIYSMGT